MDELETEKLVFDPNKCTGCLYCEMICAFRHKGAFSRDGSLIRIATDEKTIVHEAQFCAHCRVHVCADLCKADAIVVKDSGLVSVDAAKCTGCGLCVSGCPLGGIFIDREARMAVNCDLCQGSPACVKFCPSGALQYAPVPETERHIHYA